MLKIEFTGQFKKDYKLAIRRGCDPQDLTTVISLLAAERPLRPDPGVRVLHNAAVERAVEPKDQIADPLSFQHGAKVLDLLIGRQLILSISGRKD